MRFERLMYASVAIGLLLTALSFPSLVARESVGAVILFQAFVVAVQVLLIWLIARRRQNWARWLFLVLFLVGLRFYLPHVPELLASDLLSALLSLTQMALIAIAFALIFTGDARPWLRGNAKRGEAPPPAPD